ncbi:Meiotically up-regulated protein [Wickerhamomyces ciferrii]|uniref:Meiotically up-regulated protein n=1 Tax=Wickerhamomyces ciferrii (strain ATCC 14091 / BCRC 22168 / CBS 111 / JCM 3599 / NBRC 0793 / NRRL Y-1031 F-60-10) TaxID=1206466 RepID=K0KIL5_WICCF|nr:Meiotically up-regulated protein [Wickerhamomyces ciferrii]CCH41003.1 Meiotically up-regulated protein [Wickerhamomyces ciferrii]
MTSEKKPFTIPYSKQRFRRIRPLRLVLGIVIALGLIYVIRGIGNDDDDDIDYLNHKLEQLYNVDNQIKINNHDGNGGSILDKDNLHQYKKPKTATNSRFRAQTCENYVDYSQELHQPFSEGPLELPFQRPPENCRTFVSPAVDKVIEDLKQKIKDPDLARLVENALPNTLDTTILWHKPKGSDLSTKYSQSFVVTGDIHAEWLRDAARQLSIYHNFTNQDEDLKELMRGAINTQASYILINPYCNAFHPPPGSGIKKGQTHIDKVSPRVNWRHVFECKWEIDSLASFLTLTNEYFEATNDYTIFNTLWFNAVTNIIKVIHRQQSPTFDEKGTVLPFYYTFQRDTNVGTETLPLAGTGNPVNYNIGLVRSAFRPSDDACIFQFFIPGNAHISIELLKISKNLKKIQDKIPQESIDEYIEETAKLGNSIRDAIFANAIFEHKEFGKVFAFEIDGYGGANFMDDANIPSLLSLPDLGFLSKDDPIYQNTRKMILSNRGNPYYIQGKFFKGIGGPHIGIHNAWPMSLLMSIRTSDDDEEILENLSSVLHNTAGLGLIHESIQVQYPGGVKFTRPWFAWANSEFGKTILDLAQRKPHLIFKDEYAKTPYSIPSVN